jgi:hypothetical protein
MTIQPLSNRPPEISVTEAIEPAYDRVKRMLFQPFDLSKWIVIGFCAWLAGLGQSGGSGGYSGFNGANPNGQGAQPGEQFRHFYHQASDYVLANLDWIIPLSAFLVLLLLAIWLLVLWLSSRGKFMFLHCVVWDRAEVDVPWHQYASAANSLFRFRLAVGLVGLVVFLPLLGFVAASIIRMVLQGEPDIPGILLAVGLVMVMVILGIVFALIRKLTADFVVPILFLRGGNCLAAWREFGRLLSANPGKFTVYILFQIVLSMLIQALVVTAIVVTCCIACCFLLLPFVGTVLLLPVLVFKRAYPLYYLAQYGPQYDVFPKPPASTSAPDAPMPPLAPAAS